ncbi:hypothetical protein FRACYDRAFT_244088 [Fragilariopsis cylindrus CCMP1102]|uniref:Methyltransferase n=1 Tax=Fragilariopsis cylindrus CCMP1102 TaxID=635003 RepID=A0A1E7F4M6_9STRA|nr:hypothetical protein FRACYDRAFT_244088 [Fragilariopsis cylindrus CCMP1102]|eukprot:OEU12813.1 hypothetical protein FRACYDRAFT_244088 [Fragilariopsis cylindrus CCMP1102]
MSSNSNSNTTDVLVGRSCLAIVEVNNNDTSSSNEHDFLAFAFDDGYRRVRLKLPPLSTASSDKTTTDKTSDEDEEQQQQLLQHLIDLKRMLIKSLDLPLLLLLSDDDEDEDDVDNSNEKKKKDEDDDVDDDDGTSSIATVTTTSPTTKTTTTSPTTIKMINSTGMIIELYNPRLEKFHLLKSIHDIPSKCCRLRISIDYKDNSNNNSSTTTTNDTTHNLRPQPYLALPWREYSYGTSIDEDGSFVVNGSPIKINEISNSGLGTGTNIWDGAIALTKFLECYDNNNENNDCNRNNDCKNDCYIVRNKNILELGSGTGFVGISCSVAFQSTKVIVTDLEYSMNNLRQNISSNTTITSTTSPNVTTTNVTNTNCSPTDDTASLSSKRSSGSSSGSISGEILDWFDYRNTADKIFFPQNTNNSINNKSKNDDDDHHDHDKIVWIPDIILAADVVWVDSLVRPLVETLYYICCTFCMEHKQQKKEPPIILLSYQRRSQIVENNLFQTLKEYNFHYEDVTIDTNTKIRIYKITYNIDPS